MAKDPTILGSLEYDVLRAMTENPDANYGAAIAEVMARPQGAVQTALMRMEAKGFVASSWADPLKERGGRRRRMFRISDAGALAIRRTKLHFQST